MKILFVINDLSFFISHRLPIGRALLDLGYEVHIGYGVLGNTESDSNLLAGFILHQVSLQRTGLNPLLDFISIISIWKLFLQIRPNLVHLITMKPVLYGGIAAKLAQVPAVVFAISGLGSSFVKRSTIKFIIIRFIINLLFQIAFSHKNKLIIFQNPDDLDQILLTTKISPSCTQIIRGSGINLADCQLKHEPSGDPIIVMASRLLRDKGVKEFVDAARIISNRGIKARFILIGEPDLANPSSITISETEKWESEGIVEFLGYRKDILLQYSNAHIVTLPSYYGEGLPKCLIEAAACGRAVITTDMPGCRDAIEPGLTGLLIPARDSVALANACEYLIKNPHLRASMGRAGRTLAEMEFNIETVVIKHIEIYYKLLKQYGME